MPKELIFFRQSNKQMNIQNDIPIIVGTIAIISGIYKLLIEPSIDAKMANLETKGFLVIENSKSLLSDRITALDRKVDIHLENYSNYKEANLLHSNGLNEKITHTWNKTKELFVEERAERKEIQALIQRQHELKNRE
ncbi:MAG: hypothetical protein V7K48_34680 [Nostoc sp.]|uniref:hypothetical protein n=1 Tax=Nostoc sp. TaxID=1180 RepID=UPI002FF5FA6B